MEFQSYVRNPFRVEAVEVTVDNIEEIAEHVGTLNYEADGSPYILVDRKKVPNVFKVSPGYWMTKIGRNVRCFPRHIFKSQFVIVTEDIEALLAHIKTDKSPDQFPNEGQIVGELKDGSQL